MTTRRRPLAVPLCQGFVSLVGAGPGDPDLLTWRAVDRLRRADLVLYDGLIPRAVLRLAVSADRMSVSKRVGGKSMTQAAINDLMIAAARRGNFVVRLKSGDPFVLGRGGEEVVALAEAGVPFEVVPGLTTATAAPALAGIPVTHRGLSSGFVVVSGHSPDAYGPLLSSLAPGSVTVIVMMGMGERASIAARLQAGGWAANTPAAVITSASQPSQQIWSGTLETLGGPADTAADRREHPGVIVIGGVVALAAHFDAARPLSLQEHTWQPTTTPRP
jgi:uroporphyrin-III C-methyltransferase/precorrin-2 dehydrogenase/sirohydrochlorin ferrochelatase